MSVIIAVCHEKGGAGKSTASISIACELKSRGYSVLLVDSDSSSSTAAKWKSKSKNPEELPTVIQLIEPNLHAPGQVDEISKSFDYTVIDCPPKLEDVARSAIMASDIVLIPCPPDAPDIWSLGDTIKEMNKAKLYKPNLQIHIVVMRKPTGRRTVAQKAESALRKQASNPEGVPVFESVIHERTAFSKATSLGSSVGLLEPASKADNEVKSVVNELLEKIG